MGGYAAAAQAAREALAATLVEGLHVIEPCCLTLVAKISEVVG
jgi:hypothetical protein